MRPVASEETTHEDRHVEQAQGDSPGSMTMVTVNPTPVAVSTNPMTTAASRLSTLPTISATGRTIRERRVMSTLA